MVAQEALPGRGNEQGQPSEEGHGLKVDVSPAVTPGASKSIAHDPAPVEHPESVGAEGSP